MAQLDAARKCPEIDYTGLGFNAKLAIYDAEKIWAGGIVCQDYLHEAHMGSDTEGLQVIGVAPLDVDNTDDGETTNVKTGIYRFNNSATYPFTAGPDSRTQPAFLEDDNTVAAYSTNFVSCGLVFDVDADGVWVDMRPPALAAALAMIPVKRYEKVADFALTGAMAFGRRYGIEWIDADGNGVLTLPAAVAGMRFGILRATAGAGLDVECQTVGTDKIQGADAMSAATKTAHNEVDEIETNYTFWRGVEGYWLLDNPLSNTVNNWPKDDT